MFVWQHEKCISRARFLWVAVLVNFYCGIDCQFQAAVYSGWRSVFASIPVNKLGQCLLNFCRPRPWLLLPSFRFEDMTQTRLSGSSSFSFSLFLEQRKTIKTFSVFGHGSQECCVSAKNSRIPNCRCKVCHVKSVKGLLSPEVTRPQDRQSETSI